MDTPAERLKWARQQAGYPSAAAAARALNMPLPTYQAHENGSRGSCGGLARNVERYARKFGVSAEWLLTSRGDPKPRRNDKETALIEAFRQLPPHEADAYLQLVLSRIRATP